VPPGDAPTRILTGLDGKSAVCATAANGDATAIKRAVKRTEKAS
jgi:hypothetical protein